MKKVTLKDVAKAAGVSYATVSRALAGNQQISEKTRQRIEKICDEMGYTANFVARSMVKQKTELLGLVVPAVDNPFMSELAHFVEINARARGYNLMLCNSGPDLSREKSIVKLLVGRRADGIIIVSQSPKTYENIKKYTEQIPIVFLSENLMDIPQSYVTVDNEKGMYMAMKYLYGLGHRDIVYFGKRNTTTHELRANGYKRFCSENGLKEQYFNSTYPGSSMENGYQMAVDFFSNPYNCTAILAASDTNALGILQAADEFGIKIPEDISLIGFDNIKYSSLPRIDLTTIEQPKQNMAARAVAILCDSIDTESIVSVHELLSPSLILRGTCRKLD